MRLAQFVRTGLFAIAMTFPATKAVWGQELSGKLDTNLQQIVQEGCSGGSQEVIIRARPGYRQGLGDALKAHGDKVTAEFTSIDAVTAEVHCDDIAALAEMSKAVWGTRLN
jgi:hypothetical protein